VDQERPDTARDCGAPAVAAEVSRRVEAEEKKKRMSHPRGGGRRSGGILLGEKRCPYSIARTERGVDFRGPAKNRGAVVGHRMAAWAAISRAGGECAGRRRACYCWRTGPCAERGAQEIYGAISSADRVRDKCLSGLRRPVSYRTSNILRWFGSRSRIRRRLP